MTSSARFSAFGTTRARMSTLDGANDTAGETAILNCSPPLADMVVNTKNADSNKGTLTISTPDAPKSTSAPCRPRQIAKETVGRSPALCTRERAGAPMHTSVSGKCPTSTVAHDQVGDDEWPAVNGRTVHRPE